MDSFVHWLLFILALLVAWGLGYLRANSRRANDERQVSEGPHIKHRLQLLFDSYGDDSIDSFVRSLEVNSETLPIHLSIGKHFRREGEVEKAILIHQNLMSRPELTDSQTEPVIFELAKDYKAAGLFDRAEALLEQLLESKKFAPRSLALLFDILEKEGDWSRALALASHPSIKKTPKAGERLAQYCCELAEAKCESREPHAARQLAKRAASYDRHSFRVELLQAKLDFEQGKYKQVISVLRKLCERFPEQTLLALPLLQACSEATDSMRRYEDFLLSSYHQTGQVKLLLERCELYLARGEVATAIALLEQETLSLPSLSGLHALLKNRLGEAVPVDHDDKLLSVARGLLDILIRGRASYVCTQCGFESESHYWICPSCKAWETIQPLLEYGKKIS